MPAINAVWQKPHVACGFPWPERLAAPAWARKLHSIHSFVSPADCAVRGLESILSASGHLTFADDRTGASDASTRASDTALEQETMNTIDVANALQPCVIHNGIVKCTGSRRTAMDVACLFAKETSKAAQGVT